MRYPTPYPTLTARPSRRENYYYNPPRPERTPSVDPTPFSISHSSQNWHYDNNPTQYPTPNPSPSNRQNWYYYPSRVSTPYPSQNWNYYPTQYQPPYPSQNWYYYPSKVSTPYPSQNWNYYPSKVSTPYPSQNWNYYPTGNQSPYPRDVSQQGVQYSTNSHTGLIIALCIIIAIGCLALLLIFYKCHIARIQNIRMQEELRAEEDMEERLAIENDASQRWADTASLLGNRDNRRNI